jgi:hypothetical protein
MVKEQGGGALILAGPNDEASLLHVLTRFQTIVHVDPVDAVYNGYLSCYIFTLYVKFY